MTEVITKTVQGEADANATDNDAILAKVSAEQDAAAAAKAEGTVTGTKYAGKFDTVEALEESYKALQAKLGEPKTETKDTPVAPLTVDAEVTTQSEATEVVSKAGLDMDALIGEYQDNDELSEDTYKKLESGGLSKETVDKYIEGQKALAKQTGNEIKDTIGGDEAYAKLTNWAVSNLEHADKLAFNKAVTSGDTAAAKLAVQGLQAKMEAAEGRNPDLVYGSTGSVGNNAFANDREMVDAMKDKRYGKDKVYTDNVRKRTEAMVKG